MWHMLSVILPQAAGPPAARPAKAPKVSASDVDIPTLAKDGKVQHKERVSVRPNLI